MPPNIIAIQAESLDANAVNLYCGGFPVMPFLHALKEKSIFYPYMMNYHKAGGTSDAEFSVLNSVEPLGNYPSIKIPFYGHDNSFVKVLASHSYRTAVFHGNEGGYYQRHMAFASMGFEKFYDLQAMGLRHVGWGAPDHEVLKYVLDQMAEERERPFFYYIITMSNHCRFTNALNYYRNPRFDSIRNKDLKLYCNSLSYVDNTVRVFAEKVMERGTCLMIFGDHTPGLKKKTYAEASLELKNRRLEFVPFYLLTPDGTTYQEEAKTGPSSISDRRSWIWPESILLIEVMAKV
jgi:phosphoglycerol transferase MdoB-like AlkP superfamily enzyme